METTVKNDNGTVWVYEDETYRSRCYSDDYKCFENREEYISFLMEYNFSKDTAEQIADYAENSVNDNFYNEISLDDIASECDLELIETTSSGNGYPSDLKCAIIGFDTFEQAQELADKHNLDIEIFTKKDGWQLWRRTNNWANKAFENSADDYGDDYSQFNGGMSEEDFFEQEVEPIISDNNFATFEELKDFIETKEIIYQEIENAEDDELVITNCGMYYETIKAKSMRFYNDTNHSVIGLIRK